MKVLMLDPDPIGYYGTDLCNALVELRINVRLFTAKGYRHHGRAHVPVVEIAPGSEAGRFPRKVRDELLYMIRVLYEVAVWRPDVVHVQWLRVPTEVVLLGVLRMLGCGLLWTAHNAAPRSHGKLVRGVYWATYRAARRIIVHSTVTLSQISNEFGVAIGKCEVIPHGYCAVPAGRCLEQAMARSELGIPQDATVYLLFGQVRSYKGYRDLLTAFASAAHNDQQIQLLIAGRGTRQVSYEVTEIVAGLPERIRERVLLHIEVDEIVVERKVDLLFAAADCVVLPYKQISHSSVLLEARGYGKAVIAAAIGGLPEFVRDGVDGSLYPPNDNGALSRLLVEWSGRREELSLQGRRGREHAEEKYNWPRIARETVESYAKVLGARTGGDGYAP